MKPTGQIPSQAGENEDYPLSFSVAPPAGEDWERQAFLARLRPAGGANGNA